MPTYKWPREYSKRGIKHVGISQSSTALIYKCCLENGTSSVCWYEVFQRQVRNAYKISDVTVAAGPALPGDSVFGKWAWTYPTLQKAIARGKTIRLHKSILDNA